MSRKKRRSIQRKLLRKTKPVVSVAPSTIIDHVEEPPMKKIAPYINWVETIPGYPSQLSDQHHTGVASGMN